MSKWKEAILTMASLWKVLFWNWQYASLHGGGRRGVNGGQNHWVTPSLILWWYQEAFWQSLEVLFYWKSCSWKSPCRPLRSWDFIWLTHRGWWSCILSLEPYLLHCPSLTDPENFTSLNRILHKAETYAFVSLNLTGLTSRPVNISCGLYLFD